MAPALPERVRVVLCVPAVEYGGVDTVVYELATGLDADRFQVSVFSLGPDTGAGEKYRIAGVPLSVAEREGRLVAAGRSVALWRLLRARKVEIVHAHPGSVSRLAALLARVPVVVATYHGSWEQPIGIAELALRRLLDRHPSAIVANSRYTRERVAADLGLHSRDVRVIYNGIDIERFRPPTPQQRQQARSLFGIPPDDIVVCSVARLYADKGVADVLEAIAAARGDGLALRAIIVGDGPERESLEAHAGTLGLQSRVRFVGARNDIPEVLAAADLFVLGSRTREGFGVAVVEAMAVGLPVIATAVEGVPEVVVHERTGVLVPPRNPTALKRAVAELVEQPAVRRRLGRAARAAVERQFDVRRMVDAYSTLYDDLLRESRPLGCREPAAIT